MTSATHLYFFLNHFQVNVFVKLSFGFEVDDIDTLSSVDFSLFFSLAVTLVSHYSSSSNSNWLFSTANHNRLMTSHPYSSPTNHIQFRSHLSPTSTFVPSRFISNQSSRLSWNKQVCTQSINHGSLQNSLGN